MKVIRLACLLLLIPLAMGAVAYQRVQVQDPYMDMHTGPGRGFPAVQIVERGEWVEILMRKTDWFKVRTENGKEGWVVRSQMEKTLTGAGVRKNFRDVLMDDYLNRRLEVGFAAGRFDGDPSLSVRSSYRFNNFIVGEINLSQVSGAFSSSRIVDLSLQIAPYSDNRFSPYFNLGFGHFKNEPKAPLVNALDTSATTAVVGVGLRVYLTRRFIVRADFKNYVVMIDTDRNEEFQQWLTGFSFFF
ncbi:MAG: SH3 domain-containing protein [Gammaproteobacteria bacterium]|nr:SH3 domain-containing protein [Gammaproteobacteria bacterium]MCZ6715831.1 SH3 domain-containing protein [Gammaproteobacteria bacterium]MCZ6826314.1 SH3 domain-containing protein [Gammaproteobacteria bacterium]MCZ6911322.1 SH3 domain-containing protein [Pseudomonadota bacterium]